MPATTEWLLAETELMDQTGAASHTSVSWTRMTTPSSFLLGGRNTAGEATTDEITGGTSVTVTVELHWFWLPEPSVAVHV